MSQFFSVVKASVVASIAFSSVSFANGTGYGSAGCGLGALVFGQTEGIEQIFAATLNGTAGSQTFGITSGTSNCKAGGKRTLVGSQEDFFLNNYATLSKEAAQGKGESLNALASAFGCNSAVASKFNSHIQSNYSTIFSAPGALAALDSTRASVRSNAELVQNCSNIIL